MITSVVNQQIKYVIGLQKKSKERVSDQCFVVEGMKMVTEAPSALVKKIYIRESLFEEHPELVGDHDYEVVTDDVMKKMSDTVTPQGIMAVINFPTVDFNMLLDQKNPMIIALDEVQDPGNMGTIIRTAEAIGATFVMTSKGSVDVYNPKVLRSTMGAIYHMPVINRCQLATMLGQVKDRNIELLAAHLKGEHFHYEIDLTKGICLLIGNEGHGLSEEVSCLATTLVKIPMVGHTESLNASIAAGVLMYERFRQRALLEL